jgi:predicted RNA binding protein YcfA (HicA-like mRNA interferase family)
MPPVPAVRGDRLVKALERAGFTVTRVSGSHHRLKHPDGRATTVPVHPGRDVPKGTLRAVLQDAGLTVSELLTYL